ncbi:exodeoxyribonuclease, partial [Ligilactobacillus saerimneri]|nr:exodeoxyribonuclease [Ligilactobacillus saerimneri]
RIDYWLVSERMVDQVVRSEMIATGDRRDHCPILLEIKD